MRISKSKIMQYAFIYCMMLINQSVLRDSFASNDYLPFGIFLALSVCCFFYREWHIVWFMGASLLLCIFTRLFIGGVGIGIWASWMAMILVTYLAIKTDVHCFLDRLVKMITLLAGISLVLWGLSLLNIELVQKMMIWQYKMRTNVWRLYSDAQNYVNIPYDAYGGIIYCVNMCHPGRNCGIFTEPGIYQMVLNSTIFILLFFKEHLKITEKQRYRYIFLLMLTVASTRSTVGILALAVLLMLILFQKKVLKYKYRRRLFGCLLIIGLVVVGRYIMQGQDSYLYNVVIKKLFSSSGKFSLSASSGSARMGTIDICLQSMLRNPLGIGYDRLMVLLDTKTTGNVGAALFQTGAACGILMLIIVLLWLFMPIVKTCKINIYGKIGYTCIYFFTALAQSSEFYPFLIVVPLFLVMSSHRKRLRI